ncbi:MAG: hypothetical protein HQ582_03580 [Planctomycetes bacterium]|nr:hypothetical protein [Planctomycetota bacterium]
MVSYVGAMIATIALAASASSSEITGLEDQVLAARRAITSGEMELHITYRGFDNNGEEEVVIERRVYGAFDGPKVRSDITERRQQEEPGSAAEWFRRTHSRSEDGFISWCDEITPTGDRDSVYVKALTYADDTDLDLIPDPRQLGMSPLGFENSVHFTLESLVGNPERRDVSLSTLGWKGKECQKVEYESLADGSRVRFWVAPSLAYSVVRLEQEWHAENKQYVDAVESEIREYESSGLFFPVKCVTQRHIDGQISSEQVVDVVEMQLNKPIANETFSLAGMDIPAGVSVARFPLRDDGLLWDGKDVVGTKGETHGDLTAAWTGYRLLALLLGLIGVVLLSALMILRRRGRQTPA